MPQGIGLLSLLIWLPIAAGVAVLLLGEGQVVAAAGPLDSRAPHRR